MARALSKGWLPQIAFSSWSAFKNESSTLICHFYGFSSSRHPWTSQCASCQVPSISRRYRGKTLLPSTCDKWVWAFKRWARWGSFICVHLLQKSWKEAFSKSWKQTKDISKKVAESCSVFWWGVQHCQIPRYQLRSETLYYKVDRDNHYPSSFTFCFDHAMRKMAVK